MKPFEHGGDVISFAQALGCLPQEVIDLSSNINFVKPTINIDFNQLNIASYPNYDILYQSVAKHYDVDVSNVELFNGATSAISSLFRHLDSADIYLYAPIYLEYKRIAMLYKHTLHLINRYENIYSEVKPNSLIVFVNPSTPDGVFYDLEKLMLYWQRQNCTIVIDESFLDFTESPSVSHYLQKYEKLYIIKSMTKFYSCAGVRLGVILSTANNIKALRRYEPLWKISQFDSQYLVSALEERGFGEKARKVNEEHKAYLLKILKNSSLVAKVYPSTANFVLVKLQGIDAVALQGKLSPYKIMIRNCANFDFLEAQHVRIAVKPLNQLKLLERVLCTSSI